MALYGVGQGGRGRTVFSPFIREDAYELVGGLFEFSDNLDPPTITAALSATADWVGVPDSTISLDVVALNNPAHWLTPIGGDFVVFPLVNTAQWGTQISSMLVAEATDTANWSDTLTPPLVSSQTLVSDGEWTASIGALFSVVPLESLVNLSSSILSTLSLSSELLALAQWNGNLLGAARRFVVVNVDTGAVSEYQGLPDIVSAIQFDGMLYLAGPNGLYTLTGDSDDEGTPVAWSWKTGFSNLGSDLLKRINDVNVLAKTSGTAHLRVHHDRYGEKIEHIYRLHPQTRTAYRDGVIRVGKGLSSVYWALGMDGTGPTEINEVRALVWPLSRRR